MNTKDKKVRKTEKIVDDLIKNLIRSGVI